MISALLHKLMLRQDLTAEEAAGAMTAIMTGEAGEARTAAFLTALAMKGETGAEIEAFARSMRRAAVPWPGEVPGALFDTCGTGGDRAGTLNISTMVAILLTAMGRHVAKHGNRAVSSSTGSADLLEEFGVRIAMTPDESADCLKRAGICFLFAPNWHPAMKHAAPVRRALGVRTVFNLLGPLTNPAPITHQVIGVFDASFMHGVAHALALLGRRAALVLHAEDGLDEASPASGTRYIRVEAGETTDSGVLTPEDFGLTRHSLDDLRPRDRAEAVARTRAILSGKGSRAENETIAMNAALALSLTEGDQNLAGLAAEALSALASGKAASVVENWARI